MLTLFDFLQTERMRLISYEIIVRTVLNIVQLVPENSNSFLAQKSWYVQSNSPMSRYP